MTSTASATSSASSSSSSLSVTIELSGGAELLFGNVRRHPVQLPLGDGQAWTLRALLAWIGDNLLKERPELFLKGESVRPGILVLVNDSDWELVGQLDYQIEEGDVVTFISTLHGG